MQHKKLIKLITAIMLILMVICIDTNNAYAAKVLTADDLNGMNIIKMYPASVDNLIYCSAPTVSSGFYESFWPSQGLHGRTLPTSSAIVLKYKDIGEYNGRRISVKETLYDFTRNSCADNTSSIRQGQYIYTK